jgi:hypothetical protein
VTAIIGVYCLYCLDPRAEQVHGYVQVRRRLCHLDDLDTRSVEELDVTRVGDARGQRVIRKAVEQG